MAESKSTTLVYIFYLSHLFGVHLYLCPASCWWMKYFLFFHLYSIIIHIFSMPLSPLLTFISSVDLFCVLCVCVCMHAHDFSRNYIIYLQHLMNNVRYYNSVIPITHSPAPYTLVVIYLFCINCNTIIHCYNFCFKQSVVLLFALLFYF